ncbi:unnamed protein product [Trichobilharzia szidati]|nr:unnamed protein product [Trichobilharzia szidati]
MAEFDKKQIFTTLSLVLLVCLTATAIGEDRTLSAQYKPGTLKGAHAFYFLALFAFIAALIIHLLYVLKFEVQILKYVYLGLIVTGLFCAVLSVILYYQAFSKYRTAKPESNSWLIAAIMASFQLSVFVFMYHLK